MLFFLNMEKQRHAKKKFCRHFFKRNVQGMDSSDCVSYIQVDSADL